MLPAGIISSVDLLLVGVAVSSGDSNDEGVVGITAWSGDDGVAKVGICGNTGNAFVPARMRLGIWRTVGSVCAQRSRPVKNKIRMSVVFFILPLRLRFSNC